MRIMTTMASTPSRTLLVLMLAGLLVGIGGCANTNNRDEDTRGSSLLILDSLTGQPGGDNLEEGTVLFSDVLTCDEDHTECSIYNDNGIPTFRNEPLDPLATGSETSFYQDIQMYRYRVTYTRSDGRNTEGVDVPYHFDGVMDGTVDVGTGGVEIPFVIVRHVAKQERPLIDLLGVGDESFIYTNTRVDFWGRDIAGNEHHVFGWIDIQFSDFGP